MSLRGYIDGVIGGELVGWTLDDAAFDRRLRVRGELDGAVLGTVVAREPRSDLAAAGFGDGGYGFRIALDPGLLTPGVHAVAAVVGGEPLPLAPDWIVVDARERPLPAVQLATAPATRAEDRPHDTVVAGVAGWTFALAAPPDRSHARLDAHAAAVCELHAVAAAVGAVACAVAVAPKHALYAEHLAPEHRADPERRPARLLAARLRDSADASLLDLYEALQDARVHGRLYPRTGSRLTWTGAIHGYRAIAKALAGAMPALTPHSPGAFEYGALEPVAGSTDPLDTEPALVTRPSAATGRAPSGLVVHDGTAGRLAELLGLHLSRQLVVVAERVDPELVRAERPALVIWIREDG